MRKRDLTCTCCGGDAGRWQQWPNQDTGFGICADCLRWMQTRAGGRHADPVETIRQRYGRPGVHFAPVPELGLEG